MEEKGIENQREYWSRPGNPVRMNIEELRGEAEEAGMNI